MSACSAVQPRFWRNRPAAWLALCAVLSLSLSAGAAPRPELPGLVFRFGAGAALFARPGVGSDGALYVGSGEGYVHALTSDGSYRWSYTLRGRVVAPPVSDASTGRLFVATSDARLYALERDASLRWVFSLPSVPRSELTLTRAGTLLFVGEDEHLYGVTTGGALVLRLAAPGARSAPASLSSGGTSLILNDTLATLKGYGFERVPLAHAFGSSAKLAIGLNSAIFSCEEASAKAFHEGFREVLSLTSDCLSPPVEGDGFFAIAESSGHVRLVHRDRRQTTFALGDAPLRPLWDMPRRRLILSNAAGAVFVVEIPPKP